MHLPGWIRLRWSILIGGMTLAILIAGGCDNTTGSSGGGGLFRAPQAGRELWTIRCVRLESPNHRESARHLANLLGKVPGLRARDVRVVSDATGSTIYYGQYAKEGSPSGGLVFPVQYQKDIELIRSLTAPEFQSPPFFYAAPEMLSSAEPAAPSGAEGEASTAKGTHSLLIAVFYNTPEFTQRKEAAEAYVKDLRGRGYPAYYYHEPLKSFVYVGDFTSSDLVRLPDGRMVYGPRVEALIARNPAEFQNQMENGQFVKQRLPDGTFAAPPALLMRLPGRVGAAEVTPAPQQGMPPMPR